MRIVLVRLSVWSTFVAIHVTMTETAPLTCNVWKVLARPGKAAQTVATVMPRVWIVPVQICFSATVPLRWTAREQILLFLTGPLRIRGLMLGLMQGQA